MKITYFVMITLLLFSCKEDENLSGACVQVKLVEELCGQAIVQVLDSKYYGLAEPSFRRGDGTIIENVFSTSTACMEGLNLRVGNTYNVEVIEMSEATPDCVVCLALLVDKPDTFHHVKFSDQCAPKD